MNFCKLRYLELNLRNSLIKVTFQLKLFFPILTEILIVEIMYIYIYCVYIYIMYIYIIDLFQKYRNYSLDTLKKEKIPLLILISCF